MQISSFLIETYLSHHKSENNNKLMQQNEKEAVLMIIANTTAKQMLSSFQNQPYPQLHLEPSSPGFGPSVIWQISHILRHLYSTTILKAWEYAQILGKTMIVYFNILFSLLSFKTLSHKGKFQWQMQSNCLWEGSLTFWKLLVAIQ